MPTESPLEKMYSKAVELLVRRDYSQNELADKLCRLFPQQTDDDVTSVVTRLQENGLQSDLRYCEVVCRKKITNKDGPRKIKFFLDSKGVSDSVWQAWLASHAPDWQELIHHLLEKRYADLSSPLSVQQKQKITRYLQAKGFDYQDIHAVLMQLL